LLQKDITVGGSAIGLFLTGTSTLRQMTAFMPAMKDHHIRLLHGTGSGTTVIRLYKIKGNNLNDT
jgi:hypothetical protein